MSIWQIGCRSDTADQKFGALSFAELMMRTPDDLKQRPNGMYVSIAVPWCEEPHQRVSCRLLLQQLEFDAPGGTNILSRLTNHHNQQHT